MNENRHGLRRPCASCSTAPASPGPAAAACRAATPGSARGRTGCCEPPPSPVASQSLPSGPTCTCPPLWLAAWVCGIASSSAAAAGSATFGFAPSARYSQTWISPERARARSGRRRSARRSRSRARTRSRAARARCSLARVIAVRSRNGVRLHDAVDDQPHAPGPLGHEHARGLARRRAAPRSASVNVPSETSEGAAAAGAATTSDEQQQSEHPRRRTHAPVTPSHTAPRGAHGPARCPRASTAARAQPPPRSDACRRSARLHAPASPRARQPHADDAALPDAERAARRRGTSRRRGSRALTVARQASSVRSAIVSRRSRRTLRSPVTRADTSQARVSAGGAAGEARVDGAHAEGAPSTSR